MGSKFKVAHVYCCHAHLVKMYGKVELGFVEKAECPEELTSSYLPSKVGGKPAWLDPARLPTPEETTCSGCGLPCTFLLQVYAPLEDTPTAFHRTFFLFVCLNPSCHQRNSASAFRVFRSQLPKKNPYYGVDDGDGVLQPDGVDCEKGSASIEAVSVGGEQETSEVDCSTTSSPTQMEDSTTIADSLNGLSISEQSSGEHKGATEPTPLCIVCGSAGPKKCSRCKMVHYCSRHHQTYDWRNGHKLFCPDHASGKWRPQEVTYNPSYGVCLPEFLLVTEEEPAVEEGEGEGEERGEEERMSDYYKFVKSGKYCDHGSSKTGKKRVQSVMEKAESGTTSEKCFRAFRRRVAIEPEQVSLSLQKATLVHSV